MAGTIKVQNRTSWMGQAVPVSASVGRQRVVIPANTDFTFQNVPSGKQNLNVDMNPSVVGLSSAHETVNISDDFSSFKFMVSIIANKWKLTSVRQ